MFKNHMAVLSVAFAAALGGFACNTPAEKQEEASKAQVQADKDKAAAQQTADDKRASADQELSREKTEYRDKIQRAVGDENKKLDDLQASAATVTGADKTKNDQLINDIQTKRAVLQNDLRQLDDVTAQQWDGFQKKADDDIAAFKTSIRTASINIKTAPGARRTGVTNTQPSTPNNIDNHPTNNQPYQNNPPTQP
jgi:hypothetical protein